MLLEKARKLGKLTCTGPCGRTLPWTEYGRTKASGKPAVRSKCKECMSGKVPSANGHAKTLDKAIVEITKEVTKDWTAKKKAENKPLSALDAAAIVLQAGPMKCDQLINLMRDRGLWTSPGGKTPASTLYAGFLKEINRGAGSRFRKAGPGTFALR
jgi:hypothetical protein